MTLYHGTNIDIRSIDLAVCRPYKDFGMTKHQQFIEHQIQDIIEYMVKDLWMEHNKAMDAFYNSQTFDKLMDIETGLYLESSAYVYGIFQDERNFGRITQAESRREYQHADDDAGVDVCRLPDRALGVPTAKYRKQNKA